MSKGQLFYCAGRNCPGLPHRASDVAHPASCIGPDQRTPDGTPTPAVAMLNVNEQYAIDAIASTADYLAWYLHQPDARADVIATKRKQLVSDCLRYLEVRAKS